MYTDRWATGPPGVTRAVEAIDIVYASTNKPPASEDSTAHL